MVTVTAIFEISPPTSGVKLKSSLITSTGVISCGAFGLVVASCWLAVAIPLRGLFCALPPSFLDSESLVDADAVASRIGSL